MTISPNEATKDISEYKLVQAMNTKAEEWKHFRKYAPVHKRNQVIVCLICRDAERQDAANKKRTIDHTSYEVPYDQSTTKLKRHLQRKHSDVSDEI